MTGSVLFALPAIDSGGPARVITLVANELAVRGYAVHAAVRDPVLTQHLDPRIAVHRVPAPPVRLLSRYPAPGLARVVWRVKPDMVVSTLNMNLAAGLGRWTWPRTTRWVLRQANHHTTAFRELRSTGRRYDMMNRLTVLAMRRADALVAQSADMAADLESYGLEGVTTIANPVRASSGAVLRPAGAPSLVAVGRLTQQKGFDTLLESMPTVLRARPDAHLTLFGVGPDEPILRARARSLDLERSVTFAGHVDDPVPYVAGADLLVAPSRYEGLSNAILESLAVGTPVVATACPGLGPDVIEDGLDGRLLQTRLPERLGEAILEHLDAEPPAELCSISSRALAKWSIDAIADRWESLFHDVQIGDRRAARRIRALCY